MRTSGLLSRPSSQPRDGLGTSAWECLLRRHLPVAQSYLPSLLPCSWQSTASSDLPSSELLWLPWTYSQHAPKPRGPRWRAQACWRPCQGTGGYQLWEAAHRQSSNVMYLQCRSRGPALFRWGMHRLTAVRSSTRSWTSGCFLLLQSLYRNRCTCLSFAFFSWRDTKSWHGCWGRMGEFGCRGVPALQSLGC